MRKRFRDCVFDSDSRELVRGGRPVHLSPKAYGLLELLLQRAPNAVSKDDIQSAVWGEIFVSESTLTNAIAEIRAALESTRHRSSSTSRSGQTRAAGRPRPAARDRAGAARARPRAGHRGDQTNQRQRHAEYLGDL